MDDTQEKQRQVDTFKHLFEDLGGSDMVSMFAFACEVAKQGLPLATYNKIVADEFYRREKEQA
jgi:hypothetical protein